MNFALTIDGTFILGVGATIASIVVFFGSVWLLLTLILGARLAYFITASVSLGFLFIMTIVWSIGTPLGPVGEFGKPTQASLPHWEPIDIGTDPGALKFGPAASYPDAPWAPPDEEDAAQVSRAAEMEGDAEEYLTEQIEAGNVENFADPGYAQVQEDSERLLENEDGQFGMLTYVPDPAAEIAEGDPAPSGELFVVLRFEPGNPLGKARIIAAGTFLLLVGHLFGLNRMETRARKAREEEEGA
ncbi:MAG TPA: hypothetical protein VHJ82_01550 [Actinomycetota bacterium]|nr:hypothetical protein [Actinomycetota bacterium]